MHCLCYFLTCHPIGFCYWTCSKLDYFPYFVMHILRCRLILNLCLFWITLCCLLIYLSVLLIIWQFMLSSCNLSVWHSNSAGPLTGTTNKLFRTQCLYLSCVKYFTTFNYFHIISGLHKLYGENNPYVHGNSRKPKRDFIKNLEKGSHHLL